MSVYGKGDDAAGNKGRRREKDSLAAGNVVAGNGRNRHGNLSFSRSDSVDFTINVKKTNYHLILHRFLIIITLY